MGVAKSVAHFTHWLHDKRMIIVNSRFSVGSISRSAPQLPEVYSCCFDISE